MIQGKLVKLRAVEPEDVLKTTAMLNDPRVSLTLGGFYFGISLQAEQNWYANYLKKENTLVSLVIENMNTGEHMGHCGFSEISWKNRKGTLGLFLGHEYWGKGYGTDALMALCHFGFTQLNMQRIQLYVYSLNSAAIRVYEKCGFQTEVIMKEHVYLDGEYVDDYLMGVLVEEFLPIYEKYIDHP